MLSYALSQPAREVEPTLVPGSSVPAARPLSRQPIVQLAPDELHKQAEHAQQPNDLRYEGNLDDEKTGTGNIKWPDKRFYRGDIVAGFPYGKGHMLFPDGRRYSGQFYLGNMHGRGEIHWPDGSFYTGEFINNVVNGRGSYTTPNGDRYEGTFVATTGRPCAAASTARITALRPEQSPPPVRIPTRLRLKGKCRL